MLINSLTICCFNYKLNIGCGVFFLFFSLDKFTGNKIHVFLIFTYLNMSYFQIFVNSTIM